MENNRYDIWQQDAYFFFNREKHLLKTRMLEVEAHK